MGEREVPFLPRMACGYGAGIGFGVGMITVVAALLAGVRADPLLGLVTIAAVVFLVSAVTTVPGALLVAAQCWGLHSGFVLGRAGELVFDDRARLAVTVLVIVALTGTAAGAVARTAHRGRSRPAFTSLPGRGRAATPSPVRF